ncbi:MAG: Calx-beta domain-containing protein, partial [Natronospirillum sp.]
MTYTCTSGGVNFSNMTLTSNTPITIISQAPMTLDDMTVGAANRAINLQSTYGGISTTGNTQIFGNLQSGSGAIELNTTAVTGNINTNGTLELTQSTVSGDIVADNGVLSTNSQLSGSVTTSSGPINIDGGSISGPISSTCCTVTAFNANLTGGVNSTNSTVNITGGTVSGTISSSGGDGVVMSDVTMTSGNITTTNVPISIDYSQIGSSNSGVDITTNNEIAVSDSIVWGELTAASGYESLTVDSFSSVYGTCDPDPNDGSCENEPAPTASTCSPYHGQATINELYHVGNSRHIETKLLNTNVPASAYNQWELRACRSGLCSGWLEISDATNSFPWFSFTGNQLPGNGGSNVVSLNGGMDILLRDHNGAVIDYVRVGDSSYQSPDTCFPAYDWRLGTSNTALVARIPDGTGYWQNSGPGGSFGDFPPSEGETNDDIETPDEQPAANINLANVDIAKGDDADFEISVDSRPYEITVDYTTTDGDAVANADYIPAQGTLTFAPGETVKTVSVSTIPDGPAPLDSYFYLVLSNPEPAVLLNHFALATFVEEAASDEVLHHIDIIHPSENLTCEPATIELKACADESCTELFEDEAVTLTLAPASGWTGGNTVSFTGQATLLLTRTA